MATWTLGKKEHKVGPFTVLFRAPCPVILGFGQMYLTGAQIAGVKVQKWATSWPCCSFTACLFGLWKHIPARARQPSHYRERVVPAWDLC